MNNIRGINSIIIKQLIIEKSDNNFENHIYLMTTATRSEKKDLEAKRFQPIL